MTLRTLLLGLLLYAGTGWGLDGFGYPDDYVKVTPAAPTPRDNIVLTFDISWPRGGTPSDYYFRIEGNTIRLFRPRWNYHPEWPVENYTLVYEIGHLQPGNYLIEVAIFLTFPISIEGPPYHTQPLTVLAADQPAYSVPVDSRTALFVLCTLLLVAGARRLT